MIIRASVTVPNLWWGVIFLSPNPIPRWAPEEIVPTKHFVNGKTLLLDFLQELAFSIYSANRLLLLTIQEIG